MQFAKQMHNFASNRYVFGFLYVVFLPLKILRQNLYNPIVLSNFAHSRANETPITQIGIVQV